MNDFHSSICFTFCCILIRLLLLFHHHPVYFHSHPPTHHPPLPYFTYPYPFFKIGGKKSLRAIISISAALLNSLPNSPHLCFTHHLFSLHEFRHPCHSSWFGSMTTREVRNFVCAWRKKSEGQTTTWGYCNDPYCISQRSGWEGALQSFLSFLPAVLKPLCPRIQA